MKLNYSIPPDGLAPEGSRGLQPGCWQSCCHGGWLGDANILKCSENKGPSGGDTLCKKCWYVWNECDECVPSHYSGSVKCMNTDYRTKVCEVYEYVGVSVNLLWS